MLLSLITIISHILISSFVIFSNAYVKIKTYFDDYDHKSEGWVEILNELRKLSKKELIDLLEKIWDELETVEKLKHTIFTWGMDLALLAFSMDFVVLASWMVNKDSFPFFTRWNNANLDLETPIWTVILLGHLFIFLLNIWLNYKNIARIESKRAHLIPLYSVINFESWLGQYFYFVISFIFGFLSVTSSFIIITNSI